MAEHVQAVLDQMVAPLRDLMDRGIFSETEINSIVARRRESEYLLRRRAARKADFLRYLEDEMALEKLRAIRNRQVLLRQKTRTETNEDDPNVKKKSTPIGDVHIVQHIHFIFVRVLRKFRSDVSLHLQHAAFAKEARSYNRLGRIYAEALQVHPRNVGLWIEAASHEFFGIEDETTGNVEGGGSVQNARILLQRGLRVNSKSQDLWLQYFALEFHHMQKLRGRREILQLGGAVEEDGTMAESDPLFRDAPIPTVIYNNAIKAIPHDVTFRLKFLDLCHMFPETDVIEDQIISTIQRDFLDKPEAWIARAAYAAEKKRNVSIDGNGFGVDQHADSDDNSEKHAKKRQRTEKDTKSPVLLILEEALETVPTAEMYLCSVQFLRSYVETREEDKDKSGPTAEELVAAQAFLDGLWKEATLKGLNSPDLVVEQSDYLVEMGKLTEAIKVLRQFATGTNQMHVPLWLQWAKLCQGSKSSETPASVLRMALDRVPLHDKGHMTILLELFGALLATAEEDAEMGKHQEELSQLFQRILLLSASAHEPIESVFGLDSIAMACLEYLRHTMVTGGPGAARGVYHRVLFQSNFGQSSDGKSMADFEVMKEFLDECLNLEKASLKGKRAGAKAKQDLRRLFDAAVTLFRDSVPTIANDYERRRDNEVRYA